MPVNNSGHKAGLNHSAQGENAMLTVEIGKDTCTIALQGDWNLSSGKDLFTRWQDALDRLPANTRMQLDFSRLQSFDSRLIAALNDLEANAEAHGWKIDRGAWPERIRALLRPLRTPGERDTRESPPVVPEGNLFYRLGMGIVNWFNGLQSLFRFTGEATLATLRLISGRSQMRRRDFFACMLDAGMQALPIVSLISFLVGVIIALLGAVVLTQFGAEFAVAYLLGYGMLREMGAIMTGVIMSGRTGAAYAAQIGSMKINEELDALETLGIRTMDFVVMPRLLAMSLMLPMLTIYANVVGVFGGFLVARYAMGVPESIFFDEMGRVVGVSDFALGVFKGFVYGVIASLAGCLRGLQCGSGSDAVGVAATKAVVTAITMIIVANALINWVVAFF